ncbi:MAG: hypothetical protein FP820_02455 [Sulfurimonas sp.]|nr:hypothetical protein [Sulfurimonas sp.]MBU3938064.1 hypothetical protein [bacterium]MBU4023751.1 hypothetical protein [bacterium]MBU4058443.1 hypothetical protein [bacterium]
MLKISLVAIATYETDPYTNPNTGVETPSKKRIQGLFDKRMKNGSIKKELIDITVKDEVFSKHQNSIGKLIELDVGYFAKDITFFGI